MSVKEVERVLRMCQTTETGFAKRLREVQEQSPGTTEDSNIMVISIFRKIVEEL